MPSRQSGSSKSSGASDSRRQRNSGQHARLHHRCYRGQINGALRVRVRVRVDLQQVRVCECKARELIEGEPAKKKRERREDRQRERAQGEGVGRDMHSRGREKKGFQGTRLQIYRGAGT